MKKLTKVQREIEALAERLPQPDESFRSFDARIRAKEDIQDHCEVFESFYSVEGRFAVLRFFDVGKTYINEVAQWWTDTESGKTFYRERKSTLIYGGNYGYRFHGYDAETDFRFKEKSGIVDKYGYQFWRPYQMGKEPITDVLRRKGVTADDIEEFGLIKLSETLADARMETILKHSCRDFYWLMKNRKLTDAIWSAYKITIRRKFRIRNFSMWYDMITNMEYIGMDVRNPKYVCTKAYKQLHDDVVARANRKREKERKIAQEEQRRKTMERNKALVEERMGKYGDLLISNGNLHSVVIITYDDYQEEGTAMHHCVGGYFTYKDSLILSIRDNDGNRVETVEINLKDFKIVQSRGVCNKATSHHQEIVDLVQSNMWQIQERREGRRIAIAS